MTHRIVKWLVIGVVIYIACCCAAKVCAQECGKNDPAADPIPASGPAVV
ncbi:MAG: hypothetical protein ABI579_08185 [Candidatus Sumerlaeota bacterium]